MPSRASFDVIDVSDWVATEDEPLGTKEKVWLADARSPEPARWLLKYRQSTETGDDWAERIAAEVATILGIPHATVELATHAGRRGVIVRDFTSHLRNGELRLGNSLLLELDPAYPAERRSRVADYSIEHVFIALERPFIAPPAHWKLPDPVRTAADVFTGYLLLDALIANQDRNHQNWGVLQERDVRVVPAAELAPSFDHASSLGRSLRDLEREGRLTTRDRGFSIESFARRARTKFIVESGSSVRATTLEAFAWSASRHSSAARAWRERLAAVDPFDLRAIVDAVPETRMSDSAKRFATRLLEINRENLLSIAAQ
jgi:hypothetical protein